jgi:hypothetical protein
MTSMRNPAPAPAVVVVQGPDVALVDVEGQVVAAELGVAADVV